MKGNADAFPFCIAASVREVLNVHGSYVLHGLCMTRCNTVVSIESRTSYGTHLLLNLGEFVDNGNKRASCGGGYLPLIINSKPIQNEKC